MCFTGTQLEKPWPRSDPTVAVAFQPKAFRSSKSGSDQGSRGDAFVVMVLLPLKARLTAAVAFAFAAAWISARLCEFFCDMDIDSCTFESSRGGCCPFESLFDTPEAVGVARTFAMLTPRPLGLEPLRRANGLRLPVPSSSLPPSSPLSRN